MLYQDFAYSHNTSNPQLNFDITGLTPSTAYTVGAYAYDQSPTIGAGPFTQTFAPIGGTGTTGTTGSVSYTTGGAPATNSQYSTNLTLVSDATGTLDLSAQLTSSNTYLRVNALTVTPVSGATVYSAGNALYAQELGANPSQSSGVGGVWNFGHSSSVTGAVTNFTAGQHASSVAGDSSIQGFITAGNNTPLLTVNTSGAPHYLSFRSAPADAPIPVNGIYMLPNAANASSPFSVAEFTAPTTGHYLIADAWQLINSASGNPDGVNVHTVINGVDTFDHTLVSGVGSTFPTANDSILVLLSQGQTVEFVAGANNNNAQAEVSFNATVTLIVPEPSSLLLLARRAWRVGSCQAPAALTVPGGSAMSDLLRCPVVRVLPTVAPPVAC